MQLSPLAAPGSAWQSRGVRPESEREDELEVPTVTLDGHLRTRLRVGEEKPPCESPCPGCGAYYFALHATGCDFEQCPSCGGQLASCACR
jgi:hypothetical protein